MEVVVYNSEKFDRSKWRYVIFATFFAAIFLLTIFNQNYIGAVFLFFLLGWYFYYSAIHAQVTTLTVQSDGIKIGKTFVGFSNLAGYVLEIHAKTEDLRNIVLVSAKWHSIYSFNDSLEHIRAFILQLDKFLPLLDSYEQTWFEKIIRKLQL
jgi:hypothetical protein